MPALDQIDHELSCLLASSHPQHTLSAIELLRAHYGEWGNRSEGLSYAMHRDWIDDLQGVPATALDEACARWRRASNPPNKRPPHTAGELLALVQTDLAYLKFLKYQADLARRMLQNTNKPNGDPK